MQKFHLQRRRREALEDNARRSGWPALSRNARGYAMIAGYGRQPPRTSNAFGADLRACEAIVIRPSTRAALALLLLSAQGAPAQAPLPPGFTDAAAVADGLILDMRYFGANNFVGE